MSYIRNNLSVNVSKHLSWIFGLLTCSVSHINARLLESGHILPQLAFVLWTIANKSIQNFYWVVEHIQCIVFQCNVKECQIIVTNISNKFSMTIYFDYNTLEKLNEMYIWLTRNLDVIYFQMKHYWLN